MINFILNKYSSKKNNDPCDDSLTNKEYLNHMIQHHQVAIDMSIKLQKITKWPKIKHILRKLIWTQNYEINMMKDLLTKLPENNENIAVNSKYRATVSDYTFPNKINVTNTYCDPYFFNPEAHMEHMKDIKLNDEIYINHMIPHHQVAVDMSKKLLKNTKNTFMIQFAYRIIHSQQDEIILLNDLLNNKELKYTSLLI